jgi:hypothetical protein
VLLKNIFDDDEAEEGERESFDITLGRMEVISHGCGFVRCVLGGWSP